MDLDICENAGQHHDFTRVLLDMGFIPTKKLDANGRNFVFNVFCADEESRSDNKPENKYYFEKVRKNKELLISRGYDEGSTGLDKYGNTYVQVQKNLNANIS